MEKLVSVNEIIAISDVMKKQIIALHELYQSLLPLVNEEHDAIGCRDLILLQDISVKKTIIGQQIEIHFSLLKERILCLKDFYELALNKSWENQLGITEGISLLKSLLEVVEKTSLQKTVLQKNISGLEIISDEFIESFNHIQPSLEKNRVVVRVMLEDNRQNYKFWAGIADEESSAYNSSGLKDASGRSSIFQVRA